VALFFLLLILFLYISLYRPTIPNCFRLLWTESSGEWVGKAKRTEEERIRKNRGGVSGQGAELNE